MQEGTIQRTGDGNFALLAAADGAYVAAHAWTIAAGLARVADFALHGVRQNFIVASKILQELLDRSVEAQRDPVFAAMSRGPAGGEAEPRIRNYLEDIAGLSQSSRCVPPSCASPAG